MKWKLGFTLTFGSLLLAAPMALADKAHWSYAGKDGPDHWGELSPAYTACATGHNQSPVNLTGFAEADLHPLTLHYKAGGNKIVNNSHTIMVAHKKGSELVLDGHHFALKQFHFHAPSENKINGKSFPLEVHLVHADNTGHLAVVAVMFEEGKASDLLGKIWENMPEKPGTKALQATLSVEDILPKDRDYYRFNGSLTTPPCTEGVLWLVMKQTMTDSKEHIEKFSHVMHHANNRPVQPLNARAVLK